MMIELSSAACDITLHPNNPTNKLFSRPNSILTMAPIAIHTLSLDTKPYSDMSETPSPDGPLLAIQPSKTTSSISTTWLKLNSTAPIQVEVGELPAIQQVEVGQLPPSHQDEPFSGAKKLRYILENTDELIVCPGVYDGLSARTAIELGFKAMYMVRLDNISSFSFDDKILCWPGIFDARSRYH